MIKALCNICGHPILIDAATGNRFDSPDIGHRHKKPLNGKFAPGQYSSEQIAEMEKYQTKGFCIECNHTFSSFHEAFKHMMHGEYGKHTVHSVPPQQKK